MYDSKSFFWLEKASAKGVPSAQAMLGYMYWSGRGIPPDKTMAAKWWQSAIDQRTDPTVENLEVLLNNDLINFEDYLHVMDALKHHTNKMLAYARFEVGKLHLEGSGLKLLFVLA